MSMHIYWSSIFLLPMSVVHEVERICKSLLWHGVSNINKGGMVKWETVCKSKSYGGLNVKPLHKWNQADISRHIMGFGDR